MRNLNLPEPKYWVGKAKVPYDWRRPTNKSIPKELMKPLCLCLIKSPYRHGAHYGAYDCNKNIFLACNTVWPKSIFVIQEMYDCMTKKYCCNTISVWQYYYVGPAPASFRKLVIPKRMTIIPICVTTIQPKEIFGITVRPRRITVIPNP